MYEQVVADSPARAWWTTELRAGDRIVFPTLRMYRLQNGLDYGGRYREAATQLAPIAGQVWVYTRRQTVVGAALLKFYHPDTGENLLLREVTVKSLAERVPTVEDARTIKAAKGAVTVLSHYTGESGMVYTMHSATEDTFVAKCEGRTRIFFWADFCTTWDWA